MPTAADLLFNPPTWLALRSLVVCRNCFQLETGVLPMEKVNRSRPQRSLVRRLVAPVAAMALLSGGGWGGYHYYLSQQADDAPTDDAVVAAHSAGSTKDELKKLFADAKKPSSSYDAPQAADRFKKNTVEQADRYAQAPVKPTQLPVAPSDLAANVEKNETSTESESLVPQALLGNRYATSLPTAAAPTIEEEEFHEEAPTTEEAASEVARGQEPSANPLRNTDSAEAAPDMDARAAFGAALTKAPKPTANPFAAKSPQNNEDDALSNALQNARPLASSQPAPPPPGSSRYQLSPAAQASPSAPPLVEQQQRPAPPLDIQNPPMTQAPSALPVTPAEPRQHSPLGAPPAALQATRPCGTIATKTRRRPGQHYADSGLSKPPWHGSSPANDCWKACKAPRSPFKSWLPKKFKSANAAPSPSACKNSGQRTAQNVQIRDEIPLGTELVGTAPRANVSGSEIIWDLGTLSPGEERTVEMELLPKEEGELGSVAMVSISAQASAKSRCTRPELALRLTSKPQVHIGDQHVVQIEISNPGSGDATGGDVVRNGSRGRESRGWASFGIRGRHTAAGRTAPSGTDSHGGTGR